MEFPKEERCQEGVCGEGSWGAFHQHQCYRKAIVEREGKRYCKIHDPEYIKEKERKWQEKFDKDWANRQKGYAFASAKGEACRGLTLQELQAVTPSLVRAAPAMYEALKELSDYLYALGGNEKLIPPKVYQQIKTKYLKGYKTLALADRKE